MSINKRRDERLNFFKATDAAFTYLKELHDEFGSWTLAMAAY
ncbi:MAG TPA: lytic transglycosylase, partial [Deltaproteobacteria bacterium]|nr:lytic transglycosylase [Deltaproteobacteria bacterium]